MTPEQIAELKRKAQEQFNKKQQSAWYSGLSNKLNNFVDDFSRTIRDPQAVVQQQMIDNELNAFNQQTADALANPAIQSRRMASIEDTSLPVTQMAGGYTTHPLAPSVKANAPTPPQENISMQTGPAISPEIAEKVFTEGSVPSLQAQLEEAYKKMMNQRRGNLGQLQAMQGALAGQEQQMDLSPLARYIESMTGQATGYQGPEDKLSQAMKLQQAIANQQRGINQDEIALLKSRLDADYKKKALEAKKAKKGKISSTQWQAATFGKRAADAVANMNKLLEGGYDPAGTEAAVERGFVPEVFQSGDVKRMNQAERNFINAILRRESGAAISPSEFENAEKQYFIRAGDTEEVKQQKRQNRERVIEGLRLESGDAWKQFKGSSPVDSAPTLDGVSLSKKYGISAEQARKMLEAL